MTPKEIEAYLQIEVDRQTGEGYVSVMFGDDQIVIGGEGSMHVEEQREFAFEICEYLEKVGLFYYLYSANTKYFTLFKETNEVKTFPVWQRNHETGKPEKLEISFDGVNAREARWKLMDAHPEKEYEWFIRGAA